MTQPQATNKTSTEHIFNVTLPSLELAEPEQARNQNRTHEASLFLYYKYVKQHQYEIHEASNITKQTSYFSTCSLALRIIISVQWCHWQLNNGLQDKSDKSDKTHAKRQDFLPWNLTLCLACGAVCACRTVAHVQRFTPHQTSSGG